jgi:sulfatase maturation enzyme AslB (radical SAM superfamily)
MEHKWWETLEFKKFYTKALSTATYLHFSGGEPFMVPGLVDILSSVPDPKTVDLLFVTNMTMLNDKALPLIETFKSVSFAVSLEGVGHHNDYVRYGSDFATIEKNLLRIKDLIPNQTWMSINHTFQHTSIYSLPALIDWCCAHGFLLHFSLHGGEEYMRINSVPPSDMAQFKTWIDQSSTKPEIKSYIDQVIDSYCYDPALNVQFRRYTDMLDSIRGTSFEATFTPSA